MKRLLLQSKKNFLCMENGKLLIDYPIEQNQKLREWIADKFHISLLYGTPIPNTNVILCTVKDENGSFHGKLCSLQKATVMLAGEKAIIDYLQSGEKTFDVQLQYGVLKGKLVSIEEISIEKRGLRCNCKCPGCNQPLIAKLGEKRRKHFSHRRGSVCSIEQAQQTAVHILAKEIIEEEKAFLFPGFCISWDDLGWNSDICRRYLLPELSEYNEKECYAVCTSVDLERRVSDFVPDVVVRVKGRVCLVEIAVTHFVDEVKQQKINKLALPVVEVDLSAFLGQQISRDIVRDALLKKADNKKWLFNPRRMKNIEQAKEKYALEYEEACKREEAEQRKRKRQLQEQERQAREKEVRRIKTASFLEDLFAPENYKGYKYELQKLRSDKKFRDVLSTLHFYTELNKGVIPFFLDIPITGEMVFACDRRIWQSAIFDKFIYYRRMDITHNVNVENVKKWIKEYARIIPINWNLAYRVCINVNGNSHVFSLFDDVVKRYFFYLRYLGFLNDSLVQMNLVQSNSIIPPNTDNARRLQNALNSVDHFASNIDGQVSEILGQNCPNNVSYSQDPQMKRLEKELRERREKEYRWGEQWVAERNFDGNEPIFDNFGRRWLKCKKCEKIKREDEMLSYGGEDGCNKGICKSCRKNRF